MKKVYRIMLFLTLGLLFCSFCRAQPFDPIVSRLDVRDFINEMVLKYQFNSIELTQLFSKVSLQNIVVTKLKDPYEANPWNIYKQHFVENDYVEVGAAFWQEHEKILNEAYKKYGVPPEIIIAIIGIETKYGTNLGGFRVIDSLSTLAFQNTIRTDFFRMELTQFLLYCRKNNIDPLSVYGSYAGAFGIPQFMPSSIMTFAISSTPDGKIDLTHNMDDAILSIANFLQAHGWQSGKPIAERAIVNSPQKISKLQSNFQNPDLTIEKLNHYGLSPSHHIDPKTAFGIFMLDIMHHRNQYWLGFGNYYVIRKYNQSFLYAMAVYSLSRNIVNARNKLLHEKSLSHKPSLAPKSEPRSKQQTLK